jgi:hypothetical protein
MNQLTDKQREVFIWAIECAASAPAQKNKYATKAGVSWWRIEKLRDALEAAGIDWQEVKRQQDND